MVVAPVILNAVPLPAVVPPQETVYHCQVEPVPRLPPVSVSVKAIPGQTVNEGVPVTEVGADDTELTVTTAVKQPVVLQVPSART